MLCSRYRDFLVTAVSLDPSHPSPLPAICETCTWLPRSYSDLFYARLVFLETTDQCAGAFMKVSESLCQFVEDSATRVCLSRNSSGTCCSLFRSLWKMIFLIKWVKFVAYCAGPSACSGRGRFQRPVTWSGTGTRRRHSAWTCS